MMRDLVLLFWADVGLWMEWLGVEFNEVWHADNPVLNVVVSEPMRAVEEKKGGGKKLTLASELRGTGMFGIATSASSLCSTTESGCGSSSSAYSNGSLCLRSGEERRSSCSGGSEAAEEGALVG